MPLLGMLAAGAAKGAQNASNMNVDAINKVEMMQIQGQSMANAAAIKAKYAEMQFQRKTDFAREQSEANRQHDMDKADKSLAARKELADSRLSAQMKVEGIKQGNRVAMEKLRQSNKTGGILAEGDYKYMSSEGRLARDMVQAGKAANEAEAFDEISRQKLLRGVANNNFIQSPEQLMEFENKYKAAKGTPKVENIEDLIPEFNPKKGILE